MMSNSTLVSYTKISPNRNSPRNHAIDLISIHCVVGQCSVETLGNIFAPTSREASCNYGIGADGRVGMYVEEKDRSWCTSSGANDHRAVTIECASDTTHPYAVNDKAYATLIKLCVDICRRNGKSKLLWFGDKDKTLAYTPKSDEMVLTVHRWFANKSCPGDYLYNLHGQIASEVTAQLSPKKPETQTPAKTGRYNKIADMPGYAQPTIIKMTDKGIIGGSGGAKDENGRPADLDLSIDMIRVFVTNDRAGLYD